MEELRDAAIAYYNNSPIDIQQKARNFFASLDMNRDDKISFSEYVQFLQQSGNYWIHTNFFKELDRNGDGSLDFWEVLTLYYIIKTRRVWCNGCRAFLKGLYFTCVECFDHSDNTFDLCPTCYQRGTFGHHHTNFLDSYVLLRSRRSGPSTSVTNTNPPIIIPPQPIFLVQPGPARANWWDAFQALDAALGIGTMAVYGCTIM